MKNIENKIEILIKNKEDLTSHYHKRQEVIATYKLEEETTFLNDKWYQEELDKINPKIEMEYMSLEDKYLPEVITTIIPEVITTIIPEVITTIIPEVITTELKKTIIPEELFAENLKKNELIYEEFKKETSQNNPVIDKHIGYFKKIGYGAGISLTTYALNVGLTSIGLPPITGLKYIGIGGIKIAGMFTTAAINYGVSNPDKVAGIATGASLPIAYKYVEKGVKNLTGKKEDTLVDTPSLPVVDPSKLESHSIYDFFELIGSLTWKVIKKIHDFF